MSKEKKRALITGVNGQDGSFLAEILLERDYSVTGLVRRSSTSTTERLDSVLGRDNFNLVEGDVSDFSSISGVIKDSNPDEVYNTAAQSHVQTSFDQPLYTLDTNTKGLVNILECIRQFSSHTKLLQCSTSEMFGNNFDVDKNGKKFQSENTQLVPASPYGVSKVAAHNMIDVYRKSYNLHLSSAITYNHESERRGENFVTRKITKYLGKLVNNLDLYGLNLYFEEEEILIKDVTEKTLATLPYLYLGNLDASRDWGYAKDYCEAFTQIVQQETPDDYVICTGETHTIRQFLEEAFSLYTLSYQDFVRIDPKFYRPLDVEYLLGDNSKITKALGWKPSVDFSQLVRIMVEADVRREQIYNY